MKDIEEKLRKKYGKWWLLKLNKEETNELINYRIEKKKKGIDANELELIS